ncbi:hypothetical protein EW146_g4666 [Bondarzewia mesenterica]|uniref:Uncharacterized protein n=1 Tax=Bondarzewia mesenterica TaxID=1095465 RepID=A0A4V3XF23_9AGAM|nr:hypothetical protein EW146_g4666 [Bondarzewia mesenterica]
MSLRPIITICGTTGVGKSKLAVELALQLCQGYSSHEWTGARIINADSMQVYNGMDVITNKLPVSERQGVEHLLMGFKEPGEQYVVGQWVHDAMRLIDETHRRKQIPIVVGGTSYWIQHLIFPNRLSADPSSSSALSSAIPAVSDVLAKSLASLPPDLLNLFNNLPESPPSASEDPEAAFALHSLLSALDLPVASRWHWRDTRKVLRSLAIMKESGRRPSDIITEQSQTTIRPRYDTLCFWLHAEATSLNPRLERRVDEMIEQGLLDEIREMRKIASLASPTSQLGGSNKTQSETDYTLGIYQSIGYKEFHDYLSALSPSEKVFADAIENMKLSTRKYAKRQVSWIRNKLLPAIYAANIGAPPQMAAYLLDATELGDKWLSGVRDSAIDITQAFLQRAPLPDPLSLSEAAGRLLSIATKSIECVPPSVFCPFVDPLMIRADANPSPTTVLAARRKLVCPVCTVNSEQPVMIEEGTEWAVHQRTKVHRRLASKAKREREVKEDIVRGRGARDDTSDDRDMLEDIWEGARNLYGT